MILWRLGETRLSEFVTTLQRTLFWPPVLSCLIWTSPCPTLATYASLCQPGRFINTRWPGYLSCTQITSQVHCRRNCIVPSIIYSQTTSSRNQKTIILTSSLEQNAAYSPHLNRHCLQYVAFQVAVYIQLMNLSAAVLVSASPVPVVGVLQSLVSIFTLK